MEKVIVRYKLKPASVAENETLVKAVFQQLQQENPGGFRYITFKMEDGLSFMHVAVATSADRIPLSSFSAFKQFQQGIKDRCEELPVVHHVTEVGSYGWSD